ncbi:MAG: diiron oxygenase [Actinomycetes bacterium]
MSTAVVDLGALGLDGGAHVLVALALSDRAAGERIAVRGDHPALSAHLAAWCRQQGHTWRSVEVGDPPGVVGWVERGATAGARWRGAARAEGDGEPDGIAATAVPDWGLAARGAAVEPGGPSPRFRLAHRDDVWTDRAAALYAQAAAGQWDPATAVDWSVPVDNPPEVEAAVVQVMTFLIENEEAALVVPARFLGQVHPHFREIQQVLAVTVADEARHVEVFTRRARLAGRPLALSTSGGRASLQTLLDEPDYATAAFLLSVMGEGTFVSLLTFLEHHAPDPLTRQIAARTRADEARHVAFALAHLERHTTLDPDLRPRLARAVEARHRALQHTSGLNEDVFDALVLLAAGSATPDAVRLGWDCVQDLQRDMADGRRGRLARLGFTAGEAETIADLHTRNFM